MIINPPLNVIFNIIHWTFFMQKYKKKKQPKELLDSKNQHLKNPKIMCSWFCQLKQILNCLGPIHFLLFLLTATTIVDTTYSRCNCHVLPMIEKNPQKNLPLPVPWTKDIPPSLNHITPKLVQFFIPVPLVLKLVHSSMKHNYYYQ